jgi:hypothetical protein
MGRGTGRYGYLVEACVAAVVCAAAANCCVRPMFGRWLLLCFGGVCPGIFRGDYIGGGSGWRRMMVAATVLAEGGEDERRRASWRRAAVNQAFGRYATGEDVLPLEAGGGDRRATG